MGGPRFSIVVLARDEARALPRLLLGLGRFIDRGGQVLLLDTGSSDDTIRIARSHRCRVVAVGDRFDSVLAAKDASEIERRFSRDGEGPLVAAGERLFHFGNARQFAGRQAANAFILQLDASDEVLALDIDAFDGRIEARGVGTFQYQQHYGNVGLRIARFYDRTHYWWEGRVHEHLEGLPGRASGATIQCDASMLEVRHHKDEAKTRHYLGGLALQVLEYPQKARWWHYLGRELFYGRWYRSAIEVLETHVAMANAWATERSESLCLIGACLEALHCPDEAEASYRRAFDLDPTRREPLLRLAAARCRAGDFDAAAGHASQALAIPRTSPYPELEENYTWIPHSLLYWSLFWLGRKDEAREHWEIYRALAPEEAWTRDHARLFPPAVAAGDGPTPAAAAGAPASGSARS